MKFILTVILCIFITCTFILPSSAQNPSAFCGADALHKQKMDTDPAYRQRHEQTEEKIYSAILKKRVGILEKGAFVPCEAEPVYTIPVVVHIIHNNGAENISDADVIAAIANLNELFRNTNYYDQSEGDDIRIEFCLASRDPNGNFTTGITRTVSTLTDMDYSTDDQAVKDLIRWSPTDYMNIWTVKSICGHPDLGCGIGGYAYFPSSHGQDWDGIVAKAQYINSTNSNAVLLGHEVGHYLNLFHTFQGGCPNNNCLTQGDRVCDTPPDSSSASVFPCTNTINTCSTDADDASPNNPFTTDVDDNFKNYMDYGVWSCMNNFTTGQKERMRIALTQVRASLLQSSGCFPVTAHEAQLVSIDYPGTTICSSPFSPLVTVKNWGTSTLTSLDFNVKIDGSTVYNHNWTGSIASGNSQSITLPQATVTDGAHSIEITISSPNGNSDGYDGNNSLCKEFIFYEPYASLCEDFETGSFPPDDWEVVSFDNVFQWKDTTVACKGKVAYTNSFGEFTFSTGTYDQLILPTVDLTNTPSALMKFDLAYRQTFSNRTTILQVYVSDDCGITWDTVYSKTGSALATVAGFQTASAFVPASCSEWRTETINLDSYVGGTVKIMFNSIIPEWWGMNIYLDDICICNIPYVLGPDTFSCDSYTIDAGAGFLSYNWSTGATTQSVNVTATGNYSVTVVDGNDCVGVDTVHVTIGQLSTSMSSTAVLCNGGNTGTATVTPIGGTSPYTYLWSNSGTTTTISNLTIGTYHVTATNDKGCSSTNSVVVTEPPLLTASATPSHASCFGVCDGSIALTVGGGTTPYLYSWSNGATTQNLSGLCAGSYTVTVTDDNGCTATASATVTQPALLTASATPTPASCFGFCDGEIALTVNGGTTPYSYLWSNTSTTQDLTGLCAGSYTVTVTDDNGCTAIASATVIQPALLTASATPTHASCFGVCDGEIALTINGGNTSFTYSWSNAATTQDLSGLCAGNYSVTVTDNKGCTATASTTVTEPDLLTASATPTHASCFSVCDGEIALTINGGTTPYSYAWSNSATTQNLSGLCAGSYTVTVTDNKGCTATASATVTQPDLLTASATPTHVSCFGVCDGEIALTLNGGTTPYSYSWSNAATTQNLSGLCAGSYTVTVTDFQGCTATASATVTEPDLLTASASANDATCNGGSDGSADVSGGGGTLPYSFEWSTGGTPIAIGASISNLSAATYTVTITDDNGCTASDAATVGEPSPINISFTSTNVSCNAGTDGEATALVSGGTGPGYTYEWSNGETTQTISNLPEGTYTVTVTDADNCTASASISITQATLIVLTVNSTDVSCNGGDDGTASVSTNGGTPPYSYEWSNGATDDAISNLIANTYHVTVTDDNGCTAVSSALVNEPDLLTANTAPTAALCKDDCNGEIALTVNGGVSPYTYEWSNSETTQNISGLCAGDYFVTVTDDNGCTATTSAIVTEPDLLTASASATDATCNGVCDGEIDLTVAGGSMPYSYSWSNAETAEALSGLCAGSFSVTVTDDNGCTASASATVDEPATLSASAVPSPTSCFGECDGEIEITVSGGTTPYSYVWSNSATTQNVSGLCAGNYIVTVTDDNGCTATTSSTVTEPALLTAVSSPTAALCNGDCNGEISLTVTGGSTPYLYLWGNSATTQGITDLCAGDYFVTVTDDNGCTATATATVTEPPLLTVTASAIDALCNGGSDGSADATGSGGTLPYSFEWSNGATDDAISNLIANTYHVTITDDNGCTATDDATVGEPPLMSISFTSDNVSCNNGSDGEATATASAGAGPPYTYEWSNGETTATVSGLEAGTYAVTATDANNCTFSESVTITEPAQITLAIDITDVSCNGGDDGSASVTPFGGTPPYTFEWSTGATDNNISNLTEGSYPVTVSDDNGCTAEVTIIISEPAPLIATPTATAALCNGDCNGEISLSVSGGTFPYSYGWSNAETTENITGLCAGDYFVTVTDDNNCTATSSSTVTEPAQLTASTNSTDAACNGYNDGTATAIPDGGTQPYAYEWSTSESTAMIENLFAGTYTVTATDDNGCTATEDATVSEPTAIEITIAPVQASCAGGADGEAAATATGGAPPYTYEWSTGATTDEIFNLTEGTYTVTVTDADNCLAEKSITIMQATVIISNISATDAICSGNDDGSASVNPSGGTPPYTYLWSDGETDDFLEDIPAGTYSVTITDDNGCTVVDNITVDEPPLYISTSTTTPASCAGVCDGTIDLSPTGGTPPYTFFWSNGETTEDVSNVCAGGYAVTITDDAGCITIGVATVDEPDELTIASVVTDVSCFGKCDGEIDLTASGGIAPYDFSWSNGETTEDLTDLCAVIYSIIVTDANNCTTSDTIMVADGLPAIGTGISTENISCSGEDDGMAVAIVPTGTFSYLWSTGETTDSISNLSEGDYYLTVTDADGCIAIDSAAINEPPLLIADALVTHESCADSNDGSATADIFGGTPPYTYLWSTGSTDSSISGLSPDTYSLTVTDSNECSDITPLLVNGGITVTIGSISGAPLVIENDTAIYSVTHLTGATYAWNVSGGSILSGQGTSTIVILWQTAGKGSVEVTAFIGTCSNSDTLTVSVDDDTAIRLVKTISFRVYPNPAEDFFIVKGEFAPGQLEIFLLNVLGQISWSSTADYEDLRTGVRVSTNELPSGVYYLVLKNDEAVMTERVVVGR